MSRSIRHLAVEGNPLGHNGVRYLISARSRNQESDFTINMKNSEGETDAAADDIIKIFDLNTPEGPQSLDLSKVYD